MKNDSLKALSFVESLGEDCNLGFYLRSQNINDGTLLRWAISTVPEICEFLTFPKKSDTFSFNMIEPFSPGMVTDMSTGFKFHSNMSSERVEGQLQFSDNVEVRREKHAIELSKYQYLLSKFEQGLSNSKYKIYVLMQHVELTDDEVEKLDRLLRAFKKPEHFILLAVSAVQTSESRLVANWVSDTVCNISIRRFKNYKTDSEYNYTVWGQLFDEVQNSSKVNSWIE